ncbi:hypothetical protein NDU88_002626 [Pleurodeles waltl]|uniref:Uncharacterized protein n=1 Tax=Pleurodeles waltl TaxID=8319 RepID=A0AAV7PAK5_PLEWA|nr:hypothetical protein NDU88_002626 [Pleurodeles waltl]
MPSGRSRLRRTTSQGQSRPTFQEKLTRRLPNRRDACRETKISTHGLARTTPPDFQGEIDATPTVRSKLRRAAPQNDAQPENKQENPRTDPGHLVIPAIHKKRLSARRKTTPDFPAWKRTTQVCVC